MQYWSVFEDPVYTHESSRYTLPDFAENSSGLCISFWYRPDVIKQGHGPLLTVHKEDSHLEFEQTLDWVRSFRKETPVSGHLEAGIATFLRKGMANF